MGYINRTQFVQNFEYFDKEIVAEIIDIFINEYPDRINAIAASIASTDYDNLKFSAHSMKGVIANFIASDVEQKARQLEIMGTEKNMDGVDELFEEFKTSSAEMVVELKELKEQYS
jgi:HPt (histidine-containing phosphotransfer) domain-containing protein